MNTLLKLLALVLVLFANASVHAQNETASIEHRLKRMHALNQGVYNLDFPKEYIRSTIVPQTQAQRANLAPHYPQTDHIFGAQLDALLTNWINEYPQEYEDYRSYLEGFLRSFH